MGLSFGFLISSLIGIIAWRAKSLNSSGAIAAAISGGLIFGMGGLSWAVLLLTFFISSSLLSRTFEQRKRNLSEKFSKGNQRDWRQVLANGGIGALIVLVYAYYPDLDWLWIAYAGAMAAVNADTWGTELGVLNPSPPRLIINGKRVERGTSGGISLMGSLAVIAGAGLIAVIAAGYPPENADHSFLLIFSVVTIGGVCGAFFDSLLGATIQAIYYCPLCKKETERSPIHTCGTNTVPLRGWGWLDNDFVNFSASLVGSLIAVFLWTVLG
jgi:uncharacterized protein (TIGR00297 family)